MFKLESRNYYGLDPVAVNKKFSGNPQYLRDFEIAGHTWAVFYCDSPDRSLGHKDYMMLGQSGSQWFVSGRDTEAMQRERYQDAIACLKCKTVIYSRHNHDMHSCECGAIAVDGGKSYTRISGSLQQALHLTLDLLTGTSFDPVTGEIYTYDK